MGEGILVSLGPMQAIGSLAGSGPGGVTSILPLRSPSRLRKLSQTCSAVGVADGVSVTVQVVVQVVVKVLVHVVVQPEDDPVQPDEDPVQPEEDPVQSEEEADADVELDVVYVVGAHGGTGLGRSNMSSARSPDGILSPLAGTGAARSSAAKAVRPRTVKSVLIFMVAFLESLW